MKNVRDLLAEVKGEKAHKQAVEMGLKYKGFGYWVDPSTNQVAYKTENDTLVPVEPDVESEKAGAGSPEAGGAPSGGFGNPEGMGASFNTFQNKQTPLGTGTNVQGIAPDGVAQAPNNDNGRWEPGPDGDNMVNDQKMRDTNKPPVDAFVGKTNYYGWTAGPDGDNFTTMTMDDMLKAAMNVGEKNFRIQEEDEMGHRTMFQKMIGMKPPGSDDPSHVARAAQIYQGQSDTGKGQMMRDAIAGGNNTGAMNVAMDRMPGRMARRDQKKASTKETNENLKALVQDPNYDLSQKGEELGSGMFGSVYESKDGKNVIKEGKITPKELAVLHKLADVKAFPNLINAEITSPFETANEIQLHGTDSENDYMNDGQAYFEDMPFADGKIAMSKMPGLPYADAEGELTEEQKQQFVQKLWAARKAMHGLGISHNDMHGGNFFIDDEGNPSILDLGLADDDPLGALMEAIGGITGRDYQLEDDAQLNKTFNFVPEALKAKVQSNLGRIGERLEELSMDAFPGDPFSDDFDQESSEYLEDQGYAIKQLLKGGLRLTPEELGEMRSNLPFLENNDNVFELINSLYDNVQNTETGQRMSNAFDKLQDDRKKVALANVLRKRKGQPEIVDKLKDVIEPDD